MFLNDHHFHLCRGDVYRLLSACFYPPEHRMFLEENLCANLATLTEQICPEAAAAALQMDRALRASGEQALRISHAALFVGPFGLSAPPYGSVYLENSRLLMGDSTMETKRFYEDAGLALDIREAPDHIAIELEFLGYLADRTARSLEAGNQDEAAATLATQALFLERLLARWAPLLTAAIRQNAGDAFYPALADCLEHLIRCESESLRHEHVEALAS